MDKMRGFCSSNPLVERRFGASELVVEEEMLKLGQGRVGT